MGYSCTRDADETERRIIAACLAQTGNQNTFRTARGEYFFEAGREQDDGAITGTVWRMTGGAMGGCRRSASFRIEPDGTFSRGPAFMREAARRKE